MLDIVIVELPVEWQKVEAIVRFRGLLLVFGALITLGGGGLFFTAAAQNDAPVAINSIQKDEVAKALADMSLVATGQRSFIKCQACHMVGEKAQRRVGPPLNGVVGRAAGISEGYPYSTGMKKMTVDELLWSIEKLDAFLATPRDVIRGTTMSFAGIPKAEERKALIVYLASFNADGSRVEDLPE